MKKPDKPCSWCGHPHSEHDSQSVYGDAVFGCLHVDIGPAVVFCLRSAERGRVRIVKRTKAQGSGR